MKRKRFTIGSFLRIPGSLKCVLQANGDATDHADPTAEDDGGSVNQLTVLSEAEEELKHSFDAHIKFLADVGGIILSSYIYLCLGVSKFPRFSVWKKFPRGRGRNYDFFFFSIVFMCSLLFAGLWCFIRVQGRKPYE